MIHTDPYTAPYTPQPPTQTHTPIYTRLRLPFSRRWRSMNAVWVLFAVELAFTIPALALFAIAQPDLYRTRLWQDGFDNKFNSNPEARIYAMVNRVPYKTPVVFSQFITDWNVVISVLSMFLLLCKGTMFIMHLFWPIIGVPVHALLTALWGYSVWAQTQPDNSDPRFPHLSAPWYISKSCSVAHDPGLVEYCKQAKAALAVSVVMLFLFLANTVLAIISLIPSKSERAARKTHLEEQKAANEQQMRFEPPPQSAKQKAWDAESTRGLRTPNTAMSGGLRSPNSMVGIKSPVTPRTMAFNRLGGSQVMSGAAGGPGGASDLPFRKI